MDICRSCGFHNPPGMRFCGNCGVRIVKLNAPTLDLPSATQLPEVLDHQNILKQVKDTPESLEQYRTAGLEASGQRRNGTVLFADLTGYTHLASCMDNEDVY